MVKTILKEAGIVVLLLVAIVLILGIIFYDYNPSNKTVPAKVEAYAFPEDVKEELTETIQNLEQNIVRTYYIDSQDLSLYEATNDYDKGKANPFAEVSSTSTGNTVDNNGTNTASGSNVVQNNTNTSEYLNNKTGKY